ncbi:cohesin loading factor [Coniella lustricola]|uniref:Cohesin loading factor n=1 Tax=Coniella lustricola TaxID=2025994 RepID=A0A2T3AF12_9PEZI|nr:cohesin loading factor [Coniella lustricola]
MPTAAGPSKSPSVAHVHNPSQHFDTPAVLTCVANDCFKVAHSAIQELAISLDQTGMDEYYKLIATGLGCLESALSLNKLPPRAEANIRLRYATILSEETDNLTEAEVALTKGIAVCEKNRLTDLKYCMQFQLLKVLYRRNRKAALVALDKNISEATTYKAVDWVYAFRFLRASFHLQTGNPTDTHAMENLRSITTLAAHRGDNAIAVLTSILEGMVHLKSCKDDSIVRVQTCIAQAARYQLDPSVHIPQIEVLTLLLDLACSLQQKSPQVTMQKLKALQFRMDELVQTSDWDQSRDELLLPLNKQTSSNSTVSDDTSTIIRPGTEHNFIVMSFVTKVHAFVLAYVLSGLALFYNGSKNEKLMEYWTEALNMLTKSTPAAYSLPMAIEQAKWRSEVGCYIYTLIALTSATRTNWTKVHECISKFEAMRPLAGTGRLDLLMLYVKGVYYQGTGDLDKALEVFGDARFSLAESTNPSSGQSGMAPSEIALLAALNRIWIMQDASRHNDHYTTELLEKIRPYCVQHSDIDIRTAFHLVAAAIETNPPQSMQIVKRNISTGLKFAQATNNTQLLGIALNLMRSCLFDSVIGDQAIKSAKAGRAQAQKAGNLLWMSVGEGMLAQTEEMQGQVEEAERLRTYGTAHANQAFVKPHTS